MVKNKLFSYLCSLITQTMNSIREPPIDKLPARPRWGQCAFHMMGYTEPKCIYLVSIIYCIYRHQFTSVCMNTMTSTGIVKNNLLMFLLFLFIQWSVSKHLPVPSFSYLGNIIYRSYRVHFVQQKVSLHLGSADLRVGGQRTIRKPLSFRGRLVWVEPAEHLCELPVTTMSNVLLQINTAGADQRCV